MGIGQPPSRTGDSGLSARHRRGVVVRADAARRQSRRSSRSPGATAMPHCRAGSAGGAIAAAAAAAETMRQALIDADALAVDHKSREAETRLRHANRGFFTQRFRGTIDQLTGTFQSAGEEIRVTTANLGQSNKDMSRRTAQAVDAAVRGQPRRRRGRRSRARLAGADREMHDGGRGGEGRHRPHHRRSRPYRLHGAQSRRRGRAHRRRGQADRGDRFADIAARAECHDRGGARRRRRPRLCRRRLRGEDAGAADRESDRRHQRPGPRHSAAR